MSQPPEKPRFEPEIIPPDHAQARSNSERSGWIHESGVHRVYIGRVGPLGIGLLALGAGLFAAVAILLVLGAFLILIPLVGLLLAVAIISGLARAQFGHRG
jgi:hypothetical protein